MHDDFVIKGRLTYGTKCRMIQYISDFVTAVLLRFLSGDKTEKADSHSVETNFICLPRAEGETFMASKLYVGNLNFQTQEHELRDLFGQHGEVVSANVITDRETGRSRGFGFVEMATEEAARSAESALDGQEFDGRQLKVNEAKPRNDRR